MPLDLNMKTTGIDDALAEIAELTPASKRAATRAQNKTLRWSRTQAASRLAKVNRLPVKLLRDRVRSIPADADKPYAMLWLGVWPIPAAKAGRVSQTRTSARAGRHVFPGSFVATMPTGHVGIFDRAANGKRRTAGRPQTSQPNLPIVEQSVFIDGAAEVQRELVVEGERRYRELMVQELNYELNVKGKK